MRIPQIVDLLDMRATLHFVLIIWLALSMFGQAFSSDCDLPFKPANDVRLPKPVDWISGKMPLELKNSVHADLHTKFFRRNKFNQLTMQNLTEIEMSIRAVMASAELPELRTFQFELATVLLQNRPTKATATEALQLLKESVKGKLLPVELQSQAYSVKKLALEIITEATPHPPLRQVNWAVANECPLCCKGCYFNFRNTAMTLDQVALVAGKLKNEGVAEIILTGGDPLLAKDFNQIVDILHAQGFKIGVDTTGYTLTEEMVIRLKDKVSFIGLPLDGANQQVIETFRKGQKDTFERVTQAIELLMKYGVPVKINTTVTQKNVDHLLELGKLVEQKGYSKDWGWSVFQWWDTRAEAALIHEFAVTDKEFMKASNELLDAFPNLKIRVGSIEDRSRQYFEIMSNGDVLNYSDSYTPGTMILGNIIDDPVRDLANSPAISVTSSKFKEWFGKGKK